MKDFEGKISEADTTKLNEQKSALKTALDENKPFEEIKKLSEDLQQTMYAISQAAYAQVQQESEAQNAGGENAGTQEEKPADDDVIDAEFSSES